MIVVVSEAVVSEAVVVMMIKRSLPWAIDLLIYFSSPHTIEHWQALWHYSKNKRIWDEVFPARTDANLGGMWSFH